MGKPQTFDIIAVSIPDSNVQKAVARIMVGADRYLSMQDALDQVKAPPVLLFKGTELKDAEQHIAKLKALGVGFRVVRAEDGADDDSIMRDDELPGAAPRNAGAVKGPIEAAHSEANAGNAWGSMPPVGPVGSVMDAISHHHHPDHGGAGDNKGKGRTGEFSGFGGAGGGHGGGGGSGINAGSGLIGDLKKSESASNKRNRLVSIVLAATLVIIALFFVLSKNKTFNVKKITFPTLSGGPKKQAKPTGGGTGEAGTDDKGADEANAGASPERPFGGATPDPERRPDIASNEKRRNNINSRQKQQANNFIDSAKTLGNSLDKQVAFYKIAISFNQYNLQAWHGLLQTYREMNDAAEVRSTEAQMKAIFGEEVNSINAAVTQFGEIVDAYTNESGSYRIEYKTKKTSQEDILRDVFNLTRAVRNTCNCLNISVFASTSPGNGLMVHSTAATSVHTLPDFSRTTHILWFE